MLTEFKISPVASGAEITITGQITVTRFPDHTAKIAQEDTGTWDELRRAILTQSAPAKASLPWLKLARFGALKTAAGSLRHDANVLAITGIEADYDGKTVTPEDAEALLKGAGVRALIYTSPSHTDDKPRWRVLCPVSAELPPEQREGLVARLNGVLGGILARESFTLSQAYYFGSVNENPAHRAIWVDGEAIDLLSELDAGAVGKPDAGGRAKAKLKTDAAVLFEDIRSGASYHAPTIRLAGIGAANGVAKGAMQEHIEAAFDAVPVEGRDRRWEDRRGDVGRCIDDAYTKESAKGGGREEKTSLRDQVIDAVLGAGVTLWKDADHNAFARIPVGGNGASKNLAVRGRGFSVACRQIYGEANPVLGAHGVRPGSISDHGISEAIPAFEAMALGGDEVCEPSVRLFGDKGGIWIDLGDDTYRAVRAVPGSWSVETVVPAPLVRRDGMRPLPVPVRRDGSLATLRGLLNVGTGDGGDADFRLMVAWLVAALNPTGPYPLIAIDGEQGSGKSTACLMLRRLVDPNAAAIRAMPRSEDDLLLAAMNGRVVGLDNVSYLEADMADALCRVATGAGFSKRTLYSNLDETIVSVCRPILLNGIPSLLSRGDLADRAIAVTLPVIPETRRKGEREVWQEFEAAAPGIFALLLDGLATALARLPTLKLDRLPRMADFAKLACAAAPAFGWDEAQMMEALERNRKASVETVVENDPVAVAVREIAEENANGWEGSATKLLEEINDRHSVTDAMRREKGWPKDGARLSTRLKRSAPALRMMGVLVDTAARKSGGGRVVRISAVGGGG